MFVMMVKRDDHNFTKEIREYLELVVSGVFHSVLGWGAFEGNICLLLLLVAIDFLTD